MKFLPLSVIYFYYSAFPGSGGWGCVFGGFTPKKRTPAISGLSSYDLFINSILNSFLLWYKLNTLPCACCGHCVLSQHSLIWLQSSYSDAIGLGQGGSIEAEPPCESRFKTMPHAAWWGACFNTGQQKPTHFSRLLLFVQDRPIEK
jgi:hypothetical protein